MDNFIQSESLQRYAHRHHSPKFSKMYISKKRDNYLTAFLFQQEACILWIVVYNFDIISQHFTSCSMFCTIVLGILITFVMGPCSTSPAGLHSYKNIYIKIYAFGALPFTIHRCIYFFLIKKTVKLNSGVFQIINHLTSSAIPLKITFKNINKKTKQLSCPCVPIFFIIRFSLWS